MKTGIKKKLKGNNYCFKKHLSFKSNILLFLQRKKKYYFLRHGESDEFADLLNKVYEIE